MHDATIKSIKKISKKSVGFNRNFAPYTNWVFWACFRKLIHVPDKFHINHKLCERHTDLIYISCTDALWAEIAQTV